MSSSTNSLNYLQSKDTHIDWSTHKTDVNFYQKRFGNAYMGSHWLSDMSILLELEKQSIPAHSFIVAAASPVLEKCIFGTGNIVNTDRVIRIPECTLSEFKVFLCYLYTGVVDRLNIENAPVLLTLAHFYDLPDFEIKTAECIDKGASTDNACSIFDRIHELPIPVTDFCRDFILSNIKEVLVDGSLMRMEDDALKIILTNPNLKLSKLSDLLEPMITQAKEECNCRNLPITVENLRSILINRLYLIPFHKMESDEFMKCLRKVGERFFTKSEICKIIFQIVKRC